jgi:hypothetical protein
MLNFLFRSTICAIYILLVIIIFDIDLESLNIFRQFLGVVLIGAIYPLIFHWTEKEFIKYQHVERFGTSEVEDIELGECYVFDKIDGSNGTLWLSDGEIQYGSRRRHLVNDLDNNGFKATLSQDERYVNFFKKYPNVRLYMEWCVPHTLKTYRDDAWRKAYVFDVVDDRGYIHYETYRQMLEEFNIDYIPAICKIINPTYDRLLTIAQTQANFLIKDDGGPGEGIVVKRYDFRNKYGRTTWAKIVLAEFKDKHRSFKTNEVQERDIVEQMIVDNYCTESLIEKVYANIVNEYDSWQSKFIPRLLATVYYDLIREESWNFIKKYKNPKIDFKLLQKLCNNKIKQVKSELF